MLEIPLDMYLQAHHQFAQVCHHYLVTNCTQFQLLTDLWLEQFWDVATCLHAYSIHFQYPMENLAK